MTTMKRSTALFLTSALLLVVSVPSPSARLGETEEDLVKRHGEVTIRYHAIFDARVCGAVEAAENSAAGDKN